MAFPTTGVLSSGTGADEEPLSEGGLYVSDIQQSSGSVGGIRRVSNAFGPSTTKANGQSRRVGTFGPDSEAYFTVVAKSASTNSMGVWVRIQNPGLSTAQGYALYVSNANGIEVWKLVSNTFTKITAGTLGAMGTTYAIGDSFGLEIIGNVLTVYKQASGSGTWTAIGTGTDSSISGSGQIGMQNNVVGNAGRMKDFGGGTVSTVPIDATLVVPEAGLEAGGTLPTVGLSQTLAMVEGGLELGGTLPDTTRSAVAVVPGGGIALGGLAPRGLCEDEIPVCGLCTCGGVTCGMWKLCMYLPGLALGTVLPAVAVEEVNAITNAGLALGTTLPGLVIDGVVVPPEAGLGLAALLPAFGFSTAPSPDPAGLALGALLPDFVGISYLQPLACLDLDAVAASCTDLVLTPSVATDLDLDPVECR